MSRRRPPTGFGGGGHGHYANGAGVVLYVTDVIAMESEIPDHSALDPIITSMPTMLRVPLKTLRRRVCLGGGLGRLRGVTARDGAHLDARHKTFI